MENSFWWNGPQFLRNLEEDWPKTTQVETNDEQAMAQFVKCHPDVTHYLLNSQEHSPLVNFGAVINEKKYSSLTRLLRISAYVLRLMRNLKAERELSDNTNRAS